MRIGVDLGGTKIEGIVLSDDGAIRARERVPTPASSQAEIARAVAALVFDLEREVGRSGLPVGVGTPGSLSPATGLLRNSNTTCLNGTPLDRDLAAAIGRPVRIANDANCFALSEAADGAAAGAPIVFGVILGTGVGGGIVIDRKVQIGRNAVAGEWGHMPLPWPRDDERPGPPCYCGRSGCVETWLSGPGLRRDHAAHGGREAAATEIAGAAERGDPVAAASLDRYVDRLARSLAVVVDVIDPDVIVLGGGLSRIEPLYRELPPRLAGHVFSDVLETRIVPPLHGDSSGVRGAAWLWPV
jgi:fructokinase